MTLEALDVEVQAYIRGMENKNRDAEKAITLLTEKQRDREYLRLKLEHERLTEEYQLLLYKRFGRTAEQLLKDSKQQLLFTEGEGDTTADRIAEEAAGFVQKIKSYKRKPAGRKPLAEHLHREQVIIDLSEDEKRRVCGAVLVRIGEETAEKPHIEPPKIKVIQ
jgi:transposase